MEPRRRGHVPCSGVGTQLHEGHQQLRRQGRSTRAGGGAGVCFRVASKAGASDIGASVASEADDGRICVRVGVVREAEAGGAGANQGEGAVPGGGFRLRLRPGPRHVLLDHEGGQVPRRTRPRAGRHRRRGPRGDAGVPLHVLLPQRARARAGGAAPELPRVAPPAHQDAAEHEA